LNKSEKGLKTTLENDKLENHANIEELNVKLDKFLKICMMHLDSFKTRIEKMEEG